MRKSHPTPRLLCVRRAQLLLSGILESIQTQRNARQNGGENLNQQSSGDRWRPPSVGRYKVNWAISRVPNSQAWFVGVLVRDNSSSVLAAMRHPCIGACIQVLQFVLDMGFFYIELEGLEIAILKNAHSLSLGVSVEDMWLEEICNLIFQFHHFTVSLAS